jgi:predicted nucleic acid-binding protein
MDVILDASDIMAVILNESNKDVVIKLSKGATLLSPEIISYEIGNALVSLCKRNKLKEKDVIAAYHEFTKIPIRTLDVDIEKALKISLEYNIYAYDSYYLETAKRLKLPIITFDATMKKVALDMDVSLLEEK